jgi:HAE1 family hydrophobic/amphiphilic exporter-1
MFFVAIVLLGLIAWRGIPVELLPPVSGEQLYVNYARAGSEPEVVEREILLPLEARVRELHGVEETWGEVRGSSGTFSVRFAPGTDLRVRELDLRRLAADLSRRQPQGSFIEVSSDDLSVVSRFAMFVQVTGMEDRNALLDLVRDRIEPRLAAVPGVSRVMSGGGAPQEVTVSVDPDRSAALGVSPNDVIRALARSVQRLQFLGGVEDEAGRTAVVLDGRPRGVVSLAELRLVPERHVLLRHVAEVEIGTGREEMLFRVDGKPTVALVVFQNEGANLVRLGDSLRERLDSLRREFRPFGIDFVINFDAAELVADQLDRLKRLAFQGFLIALAVLYLFLREWRAVLVVGIAVPTSLLAALALLYLTGQSINLITLFGLAVGIGMLVDNSIVVYEAVQRQLEHGAEPDAAAEGGVRRTVRAIIAASATNAIVFLPVVFVDFEGTVVRSLLIVLALAILLPMVGALLVAVGLVPLLARHLAAPAAMKRLATMNRRREELGGLSPPDRARALFSGTLMVALRRPAGWLTSVIAAVLFTVVVALPWVAVGTVTQERPEASSLRLPIEIAGGASLERATGVFDRLERAAAGLPGVERVESVVREDGGALTVHLVDEAERPSDLNANRVRRVVREAGRELQGVVVGASDSSGGPMGGSGGSLASLLGEAPAETVLSGPDSKQLELLAHEIRAQLEAIPEVGVAQVQGQRGQDEIRVFPEERKLQAFALTADQVLPVLNVVRREGVEMRTGFTLSNGREIPLTVRRKPGRDQRASEGLRNLRVATEAGVLPLSAVASVRRMPPPPAIQHHNGRRELSVTYQLGAEAPRTGPARQQLERQIQSAIQQVHRPTGYTVETPSEEQEFSWFKTVLAPVVLLLFAVLAVTFESLTLPLLVLAALPLTVLGAVWALVLNGQPADTMALVGALALIGLTVNPAILLVDRMQQRA